MRAQRAEAQARTHACHPGPDRSLGPLTPRLLRCRRRWACLHRCAPRAPRPARGVGRRQADAGGARVVAAAADELADQRHIRGGRLRPARDAHSRRGRAGGRGRCDGSSRSGCAHRGFRQCCCGGNGGGPQRRSARPPGHHHAIRRQRRHSRHPGVQVLPVCGLGARGGPWSGVPERRPHCLRCHASMGQLPSPAAALCAGRTAAGRPAAAWPGSGGRRAGPLPVQRLRRTEAAGSLACQQHDGALHMS